MNKVQGYDIEDLQPGMSASFAKTVTEADIVLFAGVSTDVNPVHLNEEYAKTTHVRRTHRPGHAVGRLHLGGARQQAARPRHHLSRPDAQVQGAGAHRRHRHGDRHRARSLRREERRCILDAVCTVSGKTVIEGESTMLCTSSKD